MTMKICIWNRDWRFVVRRNGIVRVLGPACLTPIEAWSTWLQFHGDAVREGMAT